MMSVYKKDMDLSYKTPILVLLVIYGNCVSGLNLPHPDKVVVNIYDGEVLVQWEKPADAPSNIHYNVQFGKYSGQWANVTSCTQITKPFCNLNKFIHDYRTVYKVRVQLTAGNETSKWTHLKKILPNSSELLPPSFNLWATSSTLTVYVHDNPILLKLFPYGITYTITLEEREQNKNTTAYLKNDIGEVQRTKTFSSLSWGKEYCITVKVEGNGGIGSSLSPRQCLVLPEQEWIIIAVSCLSILGVLIIIAITGASLLCYLRHPEKTPAALKSPESGWLPLSVGEGTMEVVTDKGWFLSSYRTEVKQCVAKHSSSLDVNVTDESIDEDRRTSMDSGMGMESNGATDNGKSVEIRQEDSGCGSIGEQESSSSSQTEYPLQDETSDTDTAGKREDSGVGLGCQLDSSSINLDGGPFKESVSGGSYRSQSPSDVQIPMCGDEEIFTQILPDSELANVVTGYRAAPQFCTCTGTGQCTWCHHHGHYGADVVKHYRAMCIENELLRKGNIMDSYRGKQSYSTKAQMDIVKMDDLCASSNMNCMQLGETFPLLTALTPSPLMEGGRDFNMNNVSLSLCDVEVKSD